jgi:hypothetical protein
MTAQYFVSRRLVSAAVLLLLAVAPLPACTGVRSASSLSVDGLALPDLGDSAAGSIRHLQDPPLPALDEETLERSRRAELERALGEMWAVASTADAPGARWEFRYWSENGALTPLSFQLLEAGEGRAAPIDRRAFLPRLSRNLPTLLGQRARQVTLSLERGESGWETDLGTSGQAEPPPQARTLPSSRTGASGASHQQALSVARSMQRLMQVPRGGSTRLEAQIAMEDDRVAGWQPTVRDALGSGREAPATEAEVTLVTNALRPFLNALGERTVALRLEGIHPEGESRPRWYVAAVWTLEPAPPPREVADLGREYMALRERILLESQEGMREGAIYLAGFSIEQVATMLVGGFVLKRALILFEAVAPTVASFIARGGIGAVRWLRNLLVRMPAGERQALQQLWLKAETQGLKALTEAEKAQLRALMGKLENLLGTPLKDRAAKKQIRSWARAEYFESHRPDVAGAIGKEGLRLYEVHHTCPLEYAHLFPRLDINGKANLIGVYVDVHTSINKVWNSLRPFSEQMTAKDVKRVMEIVHRHYHRWFHKAYDPASATALAQAERAALSEVTEVIAGLAR